MTSYSSELSIIRFFNKFSLDRQEKKDEKSKIQKFEYLKSERCFFGKLKSFFVFFLVLSCVELYTNSEHKL